MRGKFASYLSKTFERTCNGHSGLNLLLTCLKIGVQQRRVRDFMFVACNVIEYAKLARLINESNDLVVTAANHNKCRFERLSRSHTYLINQRNCYELLLI